MNCTVKSVNNQSWLRLWFIASKVFVAITSFNSKSIQSHSLIPKGQGLGVTSTGKDKKLHFVWFRESENKNEIYFQNCYNLWSPTLQQRQTKGVTSHNLLYNALCDEDVIVNDDYTYFGDCMRTIYKLPWQCLLECYDLVSTKLKNGNESKFFVCP